MPLNVDVTATMAEDLSQLTDEELLEWARRVARLLTEGQPTTVDAEVVKPEGHG